MTQLTPLHIAFRIWEVCFLVTMLFIIGRAFGKSHKPIEYNNVIDLYDENSYS
jgi:hypothetical protein